METLSFNIAAVERDTGLSKDVLRMWERRYGFPAPERDEHGERLYPAAQVERLRLIKRLMDQGHRPGKLVTLPLQELTGLAPRHVRNEAPAPESGDLEKLLLRIKQHDSTGYLQALQQRLARQGLQGFVLDTIAPLTAQVGQAWENGRFEVFEEHLFTELTKRSLRQAVSALPPGDQSPRVLLTSVPDEQHVLGLLMVETLFALEGAECIPLGTQMPLLDIAQAAQAHGAHIVALSFSTAFPSRQIAPLLLQLRSILPAGIALWVGGGGIQRTSPQEGVLLIPSLAGALEALQDWRRQHLPRTGSATIQN